MDLPALRGPGSGDYNSALFRPANLHHGFVLYHYGHPNSFRSEKQRLVLRRFIGRARSVGEYLHMKVIEGVGGLDNLSAINAVARAFPAAVAELGSSFIGMNTRSFTNGVKRRAGWRPSC